ncbi:hypothetical protein BpHYR1_043132 [Brachionus plicatilis]|uniref:Uncharacterized protein n=1 Tax=Brachionus plicatilis TaxID=10195 RepID=A0A3M7Q1D2_BRAPC|nr:hypothetical protein BpHYR1_043132 [Brachionus plicatilis]
MHLKERSLNNKIFQKNLSHLIFFVIGKVYSVNFTQNKISHEKKFSRIIFVKLNCVVLYVNHYFDPTKTSLFSKINKKIHQFQ